MEQQSKIKSIPEWIKELDYVYAIDNWLQDYEMQLGNARKNEERIAFCRKVVELFNWKNMWERSTRSAVGESK